MNAIQEQSAGPSGFEPETAGFLSVKVKSPVLYLAELRAPDHTLVGGII